MPTHVLLIEGDRALGAAIQQALGEANGDSFRVEWVQRFGEGVERLAREGVHTGSSASPIAAVVMSISVPDGPGLDAFQRIHRAAPDLPIVVLCGAADEELAREAMRMGAQDYLVRESLDRYALRKVLTGVVERGAVTRAMLATSQQAQATLDSIGDAVISTDIDCRVTFLNAVAERLTGWSREEAIGRRIEEVFLPVDCATHRAAPNTMAMAIRDDRTVFLAQSCVLIQPNGGACAIEDSAAPIHDPSGLITGAVLVFRDVSDARAAAHRLAHSAGHDGLTDLPNRGLFQDRLVHALALAQRQCRRMAVLYLDVDGFKPVNDAFGHGIGDGLLKSVARRLGGCVRSSDTVGRQGGDEFVILLSDIAHTRDAELIAIKVLQSISMPHRVGGHRLEVQASIGIATYPEDGADSELLMSRADAAMYHAKYAGGHRYEMYDSRVHALRAADGRTRGSPTLQPLFSGAGHR